MLHPYVFEKLQNQRQEELERLTRNYWQFRDAEGKGWGFRVLGYVRRQEDDALRRKARHVLEELLQHEDAELRLRAAKVILGK